MTLAVTAVTAANLGRLHTHDRTGKSDPTHPLQVPEPKLHGFALLAPQPNTSDLAAA